MTRRIRLNRARRGIALMTGLLVAVFVLILSLSLLTVVERSNDFNAHHECELRAAMAAYAGIELFKGEGEIFAATPTVTHTVADPSVPPQYLQTFVVSWNSSNGDVTSIGSVSRLSSSATPIVQRTLYAPGGDMTRLSDPAQ